MYAIRSYYEHSCYGIAFSAVRIAETILGYHQHPVSVSSETEITAFGRSFISVPTQIHQREISGFERPAMSAEEEEKLSQSMAIVQQQLAAVDDLINQ